MDRSIAQGPGSDKQRCGGVMYALRWEPWPEPGRELRWAPTVDEALRVPHGRHGEAGEGLLERLEVYGDRGQDPRMVQSR